MHHYIVTGLTYSAVIIATSLKDAREYKNNVVHGKSIMKILPHNMNPNVRYVMYTTQKAQDAIREKNNKLGIY